MKNNSTTKAEFKKINHQVRKLTLLEAYSQLGSSECRVLKKMTEGKSNRQISEELFISLKTVENHITNIGSKLEIKGRGRLRKWIQDIKH